MSLWKRVLPSSFIFSVSPKRDMLGGPLTLLLSLHSKLSYVNLEHHEVRVLDDGVAEAYRREKGIWEGLSPHIRGDASSAQSGA